MADSMEWLTYSVKQWAIPKNNHTEGWVKNLKCSPQHGKLANSLNAP